MKLEIQFTDAEVETFEIGDVDTVIVDWGRGLVLKRSGGLERTVWTKANGLGSDYDRRHKPDRRDPNVDHPIAQMTDGEIQPPLGWG